MFYRWLKRYKFEGTTAPKKPKKFRVVSLKKAAPSLKPTEFSPEKRLDMIERVAKYQEPVAKVCREFRLSPPAFYKWLKRYQEAPKDNKLEALQNKKSQVLRYYQQTPEVYEEAVLSVVAQYPELGIKRIVAVLPMVAGKPIVGYHGVQNVLRRYDLNTYEKRLAYARSQITPIIQLVSAGEEVFAKLFVLSPETRKKLVRLVATGTLVCFLTVVGLGVLGYFGTLLGEVPTVGSRLGFVFASVALVVGSLFFAYSMKYYLTLALVLSFSHQTPEEGGYQVGLTAKLNGNGQGVIGWLKRIFGQNGNGDVKPLGKLGITPQAGGLRPNLDHIKLGRYPFFSIHLPFYNEKKVAERILKACTSFDYPNYEVIVCDDSTDKTVEIVQTYAKTHNTTNPNGPKIKVLHRPTRQGFKGGALRFALRAMNPKTEFVCVFDADFIPYPDTLEQFAKYFKATGGWQENKEFRAQGLMTMPYDTNEPVSISGKLKQVLAKQMAKIRAKSNTAVVAGYQWHVLNKSENWITRGVRSEYAGSYVVERPGQEILGALKIIHGSVYCIRADILKHFGWGVSITEDFELTLRIYEKGFKVVFTPYVQAPSECVATLRRLVRQRMRWSEGHSYNVKKMFRKLILNPNLTLAEKIEFLYLTPYYLQATFFIVGTFCWLLSEAVFRTTLPFWTSLWGWSLVLTNFFALPLVNAVGLFLEEAEERDYLGLLSFVVLSYLLVPFQAYAAVKGFLEPKEGTWFRTPKSGKITDIFTRGKFYRWIVGILPGRRGAPAVAVQGLGSRVQGLVGKELYPSGYTLNPYLALATANNQFNNFKIRPKRLRWVSKAALAILLAISVTVFSLTGGIPEVLATGNPNQTQYFSSQLSTITGSWKLQETKDTENSSTSISLLSTDSIGRYAYQPGVTGAKTIESNCQDGGATGKGWLLDVPFQQGGTIAQGAWQFTFYESDAAATQPAGTLEVCAYKVTISGNSIQNSWLIFDTNNPNMTTWSVNDIINNAVDNTTYTTDTVNTVTFNANEYLYIQYALLVSVQNKTYTSVFYTGDLTDPALDPKIYLPAVTIPENVVFFVAAAPFIPMVVLWIKKRQALT